jgi:hypothetical protein
VHEDPKEFRMNMLFASTHFLSTSLSTTLLLLALALPGAEVTTPPPAVPPAGEAEAPPRPAINEDDAERVQAMRLVAAGKQAMAESNNTPSRSVDAAIAFSQALKYYEKVGDTDKICDLEANIFWCKKRMNVDDVKAFLTQKGGDSAAKEALAKADQVEKKEVPKEQADIYLARADKYAKEHPENFEQMEVRYFEVAKRFAGTEVSIKAQELSFKAREELKKKERAEKEAARATLFSKPAGAAGSKQSPLPAADQQKSAIASIRQLYKPDYAKKKPNQKRTLAAKLMTEAASTKDDANLRYALLSEAIDLSLETADYYNVLLAVDEMASSFEGVDDKEKKKAYLAKAPRANVTVQAIVKLLDAPEDPEANVTVGKYFAGEAQRFDIAIPLLAHGSDADLKAVADMEILKPSGSGQQVELGDRWYDLGKKAKTPLKEAFLSRSFTWYKSAQPSLTGISKEKIKQRIDEIDGLLPMTNLDYNNLTPKQWDRLKGTTVEVSASKDRNDVNYRVVPGQRVRVVPHPTDTWTSDYYGDSMTINWKGYSGRFSDGSTVFFSGARDFSIGALVMQIENGKQMKPGILDQPGRIFLGPYVGGWGSGGKGVIRAKIIAVSDDE